MRSHYLELSAVEPIGEECLLQYMNTTVVVSGGGWEARRTYQAHVEHHVKVGC